YLLNYSIQIHLREQDVPGSSGEGQRPGVEDVPGSSGEGRRPGVEDVPGSSGEGQRPEVEDVPGSSGEGQRPGVEDVPGSSGEGQRPGVEDGTLAPEVPAVGQGGGGSDMLKVCLLSWYFSYSME
uniref:Uncharacterized protein n=1 Tax=Salmo trutta TaxID=8032 RepID=A0A673YPS8_SALTR